MAQQHLPRPARARQDVLQCIHSSRETDRCDLPGEIIATSDSITVKVNHRAYSPVLRHAAPFGRHPSPG
jgi:hypothetical protein